MSKRSWDDDSKKAMAKALFTGASSVSCNSTIPLFAPCGTRQNIRLNTYGVPDKTSIVTNGHLIVEFSQHEGIVDGVSTQCSYAKAFISQAVLKRMPGLVNLLRDARRANEVVHVVGDSEIKSGNSDYCPLASLGCFPLETQDGNGGNGYVCMDTFAKRDGNISIVRTGIKVPVPKKAHYVKKTASMKVVARFAAGGMRGGTGQEIYCVAVELNGKDGPF